MPRVSVRVHEAAADQADGSLGPPVEGVPVEVVKGFYDDPVDFFFAPPALLFSGATAANGEVSFEAVAGRPAVTPHLVLVRLPPGWRMPPGDQRPAANPAWSRVEPGFGTVAAVELTGRPDGGVERSGEPVWDGQITVTVVPPFPSAAALSTFLPSGIPTAPELLPGSPTDAPPVVEEAATAPVETEPVETEPAPAPRRSRRRHTLTCAFVGVIVLAGLGGALAGLASRSTGPSRPLVRPVVVIGTFTGGSGGCPTFGPTFSKQYALTRDGDSALLFQPSAIDTVVGTVSAGGNLFLHNGLEEYQGTINEDSASGIYRVVDPRTRCTETYRFSFSLPAAPPPG